jgi:hypothetical protein
MQQVIEMTTPDPRKELFANALKVGKSTSDTTRAALTRMRLCVSPFPTPLRNNAAWLVAVS